jgi:exodeoxyribonuclease-1
MSFVFYDFETTGTSPAFDQPTQFAAILTDDNLEPLEHIDIRCRLSGHILPAPWALAVTGVSPKTLNDPSLPTWFEFVQTLADLIDRWGPSTWVGYNSISFDEEVLRQSFYQNLQPDLYQTQMNGNDRLDVMKIVYSAWELARDSLNWPLDDKGRNSFKLDRLAPANGFEHHDAHDALGDVEATIHIAKLIRDRAPDVWQQALRNRSKHEVNDLLESGQPLRLVERFGAAPPRSYIGAFCGRNPDNPNSVGFLDLSLVDPDDLSNADDETVQAAVSATPKLIRTVTANKVPSLFEHPGADNETWERAAALAEMPELHQRVSKALANRWPEREEPDNVEQSIYSGFYGAHDKRLLSQFQNGSWLDRYALLSQFEDHRIQRLAQRLLFLNNPTSLDGKTRERLSESVRERWMSNNPDAPWMTFSQVQKQLNEIAEVSALPISEIEELQQYYNGLASRMALQAQEPD